MEKSPSEQREKVSPGHIIFLDIDGVLNSEESMIRNRSVALVPMAVARLRDVVERTGAHIVVTSSWRHGNDWRERIRDAFEAAGWPTPPLLDRTPKLSGGRGEEIAAWLREHPAKDYFIIDDDVDFLPDQTKNLIRCDTAQGFQDEQADAIRSAWVATNE